MSSLENKTIIAVYFDLENIDKQLEIGNLMDTISLSIDGEFPIFAIKLACGNTTAIGNFESQLKDLNFTIQNAPHVSEKNMKNRADLILSLAAFENFYLNNPAIDLYVFITSDTDFTVIMDKLRKYGKDVWLVTRKADKDKKLFSSCTDKILILEDYFQNVKSSVSPEKESPLEILTELLRKYGFNTKECKTISDVLDAFDKDEWIQYSKFGAKLKSIQKDFSYKGRKINSQKKLFDVLKENGLIEIKRENETDFFKVM